MQTPETFSPPIQSDSSLTVRVLTAQDLPLVNGLRRRAPSRLLTPVMHLETYAFRAPLHRAWGAFPAGDPNRCEGLMFRFHNSVVAADLNGRCAAVFAPVLDAESGVAGIRGSAELVQGLARNLHRYTPTDSESSIFLCLNRPPICPPAIRALARRACPDDLDRLAALYSTAGMMFRSRSNVTDKLAQVRVFVVEEPPTNHVAGRIAACALLNVESREAGLIGGVFTLAEARGRGYAAACVAAISEDLQRDGKLPCLFYENPAAGRVYTRLGFEQADEWAMLFLSPVPKHTR